MHTNLNEQDSTNTVDQFIQDANPDPNIPMNSFSNSISSSNLNNEKVSRSEYLDLISHSRSSSKADSSENLADKIDNSATVGNPINSSTSKDSNSCRQGNNTEQLKPATTIDSVATENAEKVNIESPNISKT